MLSRHSVVIHVTCYSPHGITPVCIPLHLTYIVSTVQASVQVSSVFTYFHPHDLYFRNSSYPCSLKFLLHGCKLPQPTICFLLRLHVYYIYLCIFSVTCTRKSQNLLFLIPPFPLPSHIIWNDSRYVIRT